MRVVSEPWPEEDLRTSMLELKREPSEGSKGGGREGGNAKEGGFDWSRRPGDLLGLRSSSTSSTMVRPVAR